jgi:UDP-2,4-diacetamido-2,4,6-trideoxy-beta-L-altropyranose hydrolase
MRCLALAQAWQDEGGRAVFAMAQSTPAISQRVKREGMDLLNITGEPASRDDSDYVSAAARSLGARWVVVDGYKFGSEYQHALKNSGLKVLFIDDNGHCDSYSADLILNQNAHAAPDLYEKRESGSRLLLGLRYSLLRREFAKFRGWERTISPDGRNVLISMGGSDPGNVTLRVLEALRQVGVDDLCVRVAVGGSNPHRALLVAHSGRVHGSVEFLDDVANIAELIAWADVGVAAAGTISWEICALGLPSVLITVAENQLRAAADLAQRGAALVISTDCNPEKIAKGIRELMQSPDLREKMSRTARALLDVDGARRVVATMLESSD